MCIINLHFTYKVIIGNLERFTLGCIFWFRLIFKLSLYYFSKLTRKKIKILLFHELMRSILRYINMHLYQTRQLFAEKVHHFSFFHRLLKNLLWEWLNRKTLPSQHFFLSFMSKGHYCKITQNALFKSGIRHRFSVHSLFLKKVCIKTPKGNIF